LKNLLLAIAFTATLANNAEAQTDDSRIADLVQAGKVRVALHLAQYTNDPVSGELRGLGSGTVMVQIAHALAARLGVELQLVGYPTPPAVEACLRAGACDVGFGGIERAAVVGVSPPFLQLDYTYLVPAGSSIRSVADADQPGVRIAVVRNHESTMALNRIKKHAELVYAETPEPTFELMRSGQADAFASALTTILDYSTKLPGARVIEGGYGANLLAMVVPKDQPGRLAYFSEFMEEVKVSGFVQRAIERAGERGIRVAPPREPN
jgi:polar amino acid transport system substrate-binding protein